MNLLDYVLQIGVSVILSVILVFLLSFLADKLQNIRYRFLNPLEYFPDEEIKTLKQLSYLILILLIVFSITNFFFDNNIIYSNSSEFYVFHSLLDIAVSIYIIIMLYRESNNNMLLFLFLLPIPSIAFLLFGESLIEFWDFARIPALLYVIKYLYGKFSSFTDKHNLGISIMLLFSIIFFSFILTMVLENKDPLDSLVMVSNAFTSNGYAILGDTPGGKINSLILVWSGYVISGVATATLTAAIMAILDLLLPYLSMIAQRVSTASLAVLL